MENACGSRLVAAVDTSTDMLAVAVARLTAGEEGLSAELLATGDHLCRRHANVELIGTLDAALAEAGTSISDVDALLVGRGPGSFTGVRIGISTAKGLARGANVPLFGVSTLDASAWTAWQGGRRGLLGVAADAMRGEVYPALYRLSDAGVERLFDRERVVKAADAVAAWAAREDAAELQLTGDGLKRYGRLFDEAGAHAPGGGGAVASDRLLPGPRCLCTPSCPSIVGRRRLRTPGTASRRSLVGHGAEAYTLLVRADLRHLGRARGKGGRQKGRRAIGCRAGGVAAVSG